MRRVKGTTYEFTFIVRLVVLRDPRDYHGGAMVVNSCIRLEEDEGEWRRLAPSFANWSS
jgi:hypothetical protein